MANGTQAELMGGTAGAGRPVPTVPEADQPDPSLVVFEVLPRLVRWCNQSSSAVSAHSSSDWRHERFSSHDEASSYFANICSSLRWNLIIP